MSSEPHRNASSEPSDPPPRRIDTARHLLQRRQLKESLRLALQPSVWNSTLAGLQAAVTTAIALPLVYFSAWPHLIGYAAMGTLVALFGRFAPQRDRKRVVFIAGVCQTLSVFTMSLTAWLGWSGVSQLALLALAGGILYYVSVAARLGAPGALIFVFGLGSSMGAVAGFDEVWYRTVATAVVSALAWFICTLSESVRHYASAERPFPELSARPFSHQLVAALRVAIASALALLASYATGAGHPAWAAMGAIAVMQGEHLHISMNRALQRMAGTVIGALFAWLILSQTPAIWVIVVLLVLLQFSTEVIIGSNYGLGQILVTPMALLMTYLAAPDLVGAEMAPERVINTLLGTSIAIVIAVLLSTLDDRRYLALHSTERKAQ